MGKISKSCQGKIPEARIDRNFVDLLADNELELIIVNTPDKTHFKYAMAAIEAGKNVVVEKPFVLHSSEGRELIEAARKANVLLTVFHNRRLDSDFLTVQKILADGQLGKIVEYEAHFDRYRTFVKRDTWKEETETGTGSLYNLGSHLIDQALLLFGLPDRVFASLMIQRPGAVVHDYFYIRLEYPEMSATLKSSYLVREPGPKFMVHGVLGSYVKYGQDPQEDALKSGEISTDHPGWGKEHKSEWGIIHREVNGRMVRERVESQGGCYPGFYDNLYHALCDGQRLLVEPGEALNTIRVIEAAVESNKTKRSVRFE